MYYPGGHRKKNGVCVILKEDYAKNAVELKGVSDKFMRVKLAVEGMMIYFSNG